MLLLDTPFTGEDVLTPTFKMKRNVAKVKFEKEIKAMYEEGVILKRWLEKWSENKNELLNIIRSTIKDGISMKYYKSLKFTLKATAFSKWQNSYILKVITIANEYSQATLSFSRGLS